MAAGFLAAPGTEYGPCLEPCSHSTCLESWRRWEAPCKFCDNPIGPRAFYQEDNWQTLMHQICSLKALEAAEAARNT